MDSKKVIEWINRIIDEKNPEWFLLPNEIIEDLLKCEFFDYNPHPIEVGSSGSVGVLRTIPIKIGYKMIPCYGENCNVYGFEE